jgi:hypothetical protein
MMDYYSQFPAPIYDECKREVISSIKQYCPNEDWGRFSDTILNDIVSEAFIQSDVLSCSDPDIKNPTIKYSFTGWNVSGKKDVMNSMCDIVKERKERLKRKIRGLLRTSYLLIKAHKQTMEKLYHPDSVFVATVLKPEFEAIANSPSN